MTWFKLDELVEFGKNEVAKRSTTNSESHSEIDEIWEFVQGSELSTFVTKNPKADSPLQDRNYTSDDISAFTQATQGTQGTYETRKEEIEKNWQAQVIIWWISRVWEEWRSKKGNNEQWKWQRQ